jgi:hypothetical protein
MVVRRRRVHMPFAAEARGTDSDGAATMPHVARTRWHRLPADADHDALREAILALPPAVSPRDGGDAGPLAVLTLLRLLASSEDALHAGVRRRLVRAEALDAALREGRHLDARELRAWCPDPAALQFALALDGGDATGASGIDALRASVAAHADGLRALLRTSARALRREGAPAHARADWLRALRLRHRNRPIVAFTQFADTARALYGRLAADGRVALLTATGGRIASGPLSRRELLARFAPLAAGLPPPPHASASTCSSRPTACPKASTCVTPAWSRTSTCRGPRRGSRSASVAPPDSAHRTRR